MLNKGALFLLVSDNEVGKYPHEIRRKFDVRIGINDGEETCN
jgi:hypothetical protein